MCQPGGAPFSINQQIRYVAASSGSLLLGALSWALLSVGSIPGFLRLWLGFMVLFSVMGLAGFHRTPGHAAGVRSTENPFTPT